MRRLRESDLRTGGKPGTVPEELTGVRIRDVAVPSAGRPFLLPTASLRPDLWSGSVEDEVE